MCLLNTIVKDFVTCSSLCSARINKKKRNKKKRLFGLFGDMVSSERKINCYYSMSLNIFYSGNYKKRAFKNRKTYTYICDVIIYVLYTMILNSDIVKDHVNITRLLDALVTSFYFITLPRTISIYHIVLLFPVWFLK